MKALILFIIPCACWASPFVVSDPVDSRATHCGWQLDNGAREDLLVHPTTGGNICALDLVGLRGTHTVNATISYFDTYWGRQESPPSLPFVFDTDIELNPPESFILSGSLPQ